MPERNGNGTRKIVSLSDSGLDAALANMTDPVLRGLLEKARDKEKSKSTSPTDSNGDPLYKVLFVGDKTLADQLSNGNERLSAFEHRDPNQHSVADIADHVRSLINSDEQYDALVFCATDPAYVKRFCQEEKLGMSHRAGLVMVYAGPVDMGTVTSSVKDVVFSFNPAESDGLSLILHGTLVTKIEEGKDYLTKFKPSTIVLAHQEDPYAALEKQGHTLCRVVPTPKGYREAMAFLAKQITGVKAIVFEDPGQGMNSPQRELYKAAARQGGIEFIYIGETEPEGITSYIPIADHASAAGILNMYLGTDPNTGVIMASRDIYSEIEMKGYTVYRFEPTKEGCWEARKIVKSDDANIGAVVVDVTDGLTDEQGMLLDTVMGDHPNTQRVFIGVDKENEELMAKLGGYRKYSSFPDHAAAVAGIGRVLEGYNPADTVEPSLDPARIETRDESVIYRSDGTSVIYKGNKVTETKPDGRKSTRLRFEP